VQWRIAKASVIGTGHIGAGMPCQDSHAVVHYGDTLCIAVSDGLGSAAHSELGSALVCSVALQSYTDAREAHTNQALFARTSGTPVPDAPSPESLLRSAFTAARAALESVAQQAGKPLRDYGCTLLVAIITPDGWYSMHIGDGTIVGLFVDGPAQTLSAPENGEYINATIPITSDDYAKHLRYAHGDTPLHGVALLSDGVQPMCINYKTGAAYDGFFRPLQTWLTELSDLATADAVLTTFLDSPKLRQKSDDDMTLVLAVRQM
jgi:hypothetical protein